MDVEALLWVAGAGLITALSTGLGALPFALIPEVSGRSIAWANGLASGLMIGASCGLVLEGAGHGVPEAVAGAGLGLLFVHLVDRRLKAAKPTTALLRVRDARRALLLLITMTAHSIAEGVAIGVSFGGGAELATAITVALAIHNVPEGVAISAVLRPRGASVKACAVWSIVSSLPQPLLAVPAFLFVESFSPLLPYGFGFAAGAMIHMVFAELLPEAYEHEAPGAVGVVVFLSTLAMLLLQWLIR